MLATLIRQLGDFQLAEDAVQDAFAAAVASWPHDGVPSNPGAWITVAARRKAIDRLRRDRSIADRADRLVELARIHAQEHAPEPVESAVHDDRLRLMFTCCHPALAMPARIALTLRTLGGLTTAEIARAFLVTETTMAQRLVRAKRKIADAHIPYRVPADEELPERLRGVLTVLYLIFNEGYEASRGRSTRARRAVQRGDPARSPARQADARRGRGLRPAGADAAARRPPRRTRRRARTLPRARGAGPVAVGQGQDPRRAPSARARAAASAIRGRTRSRLRSRPCTSTPRASRTPTGRRSRICIERSRSSGARPSSS